jgi:hypothetical protein
MRPIFEYDHVRGCLLVRVAIEPDDRDGADRWFATAAGESIRVASGADPPLYCEPIPDDRLFRLIACDDADRVMWRAGGSETVD